MSRNSPPTRNSCERTVTETSFATTAAQAVVPLLFIGWSLIPISCSSGSAPSGGTSGNVPPPAASTSTVPPAISSGPPNAVPAPKSAGSPAAGATASAVAPAAASGNRWQVVPDPSTNPVEIRVAADATVEVPSDEGVLYPTSTSPFVAVGQNKSATDVREVWDLTTMKRTGAIAGKVDFSYKPLFVSPDGKSLLGEVNASRSAEMEVWSFETGQVVRRIATHSGPMSIDLLDFAGPGQLVTIKYGEKGNVGKHISIWDIATGNVIRTARGPDVFDNESPAFSPNRRYLALVWNERLLIYDLRDATLAGELVVPKSQRSGYLDCRGLRFSPDGSELAGQFATSGETKLRSWSMAKGEVVVDHSFPADLWHTSLSSFGYKGPPIEWMPDGSGWLLYGHLITDRATGRFVWMLRSAPDDLNPPPRRMLDNDHVLVATGSRGQNKQLKVVTLPWPEIAAALKALAANVPAHVRPGQSVSLQIEVGKVRQGTPEQTKDELTKTLTERLEGDGIQVADNQSTVLHVRYSEEAGEKLQEFARQDGRPGPAIPGIPGPLGGNAVATGKAVQATKAVCDLAWKTTDSKQPIWSNRIDLDPKSLIIREATDAAARESGFRLLQSQLQQQPIPYFVPKENNVATLPGATDLGSMSPTATNKATTKPTRRGEKK